MIPLFRQYFLEPTRPIRSVPLAPVELLRACQRAAASDRRPVLFDANVGYDVRFAMQERGSTVPEEKPSVLSSILRHIPGFGGYLEQEKRREADQQTRNWMTERLRRAQSELDEYLVMLTNAAQIDDLPLGEKLRNTLGQLRARIESSVLGYSGLFDARRINEDRLEDIYDCDAWLLDEVDKLVVTIGEARQSTDPASALLPKLLRRADGIAAKLDQRESLLKTLGE